MLTEADLRRAEARYMRATARAEEARAERNRLVLQALAAGWSHSRIAELTGLSRGRISQLSDNNARRR